MTSNLQVTIHGDRELQTKLGRMMEETPERGQKAMLDSLLYLQGHTPPYPPAPPNSSYRRTGTLGRSVTALAASNPDALSKVEPLSGGQIRGIWGTRVVYAPDVIDRDNQGPAFQGRWWTLQDVVERSSSAIKNIWVKMVQELVNL